MAFGIYIWSIYHQLTVAFYQKEQFTPTLIYSDVARIIPQQPKGTVEEHLRAREYTTSAQGNSLLFTLHPVDYPTYLIPEDSLMSEKKEGKVALQFESNLPSAKLQSIQFDGNEVKELYLEPELVATLSQGGDARQDIRTYLKFEEIPANVWKAIIAIEDQHFLEHKGLDPRGIARAMWVNLKTLSFAQGGSTITQQLVKNLLARRTKNLFRKVNELLLAVLLEARFEKEQILERYLNEVYLGQVGNLEIHGVAQGAEHFFGKKLEQLNLAEIALMAGLIRGPGFYSPYRYLARTKERQRLVLRKMVETGQIAEDEALTTAGLPIRLSPPQTSTTKAPFFTDYVKAELIKSLKKNLSETEIIQSGFRVYTTLDPELNHLAQRTVSEGITSLESRLKIPSNQRLEGALACVDHHTGFIRALIGGRNYAKSNFNRILNMKRQIGSTFKPIVYLTALAKGKDLKGVSYGPGHPVQDAPWTLVFSEGKQSWTPKNYEKEYLGWISMKTALSHSINTVAAKLGYEIGIPSVIETARSLGIESDLPSVPSLSLGVAELSPLELLKVYSTLANRGTQNDLTVIRTITFADGRDYIRYGNHSKQAFDPAAVDLITNMLQSVFTEGTARAAKNLGFHFPAAGKTGTTSHHRDAWFAGYTPQLATAVWVGMDQNKMDNTTDLGRLTGANAPLPIWTNFMKQALLDLQPSEFPLSPLLVEIAIDRHTGNEASSDCPKQQVIVEKYIRGQEPQSKSCESNWPNP